MIKNTFLFLVLCAVTFFSNAYLAQEDEDCDGHRYRYLIYDDFQKIEDVVYGANLDSGGDTLVLDMDVYLPPVEDTLTNRPIALVAHGGFFLVGNNEQFDVVPFCEDLARMGYVAVSYNYRLGLDNILLLQQSLQEAVLRAVHDGKAAVRFIRKMYNEEGNPWGIDPNRILMGGSSAGAFIALHAAYLDFSEVPEIMDLSDPGLGGGIEGNSGNLGYSSEVLSVFSMSGAIGNKEWIESGDVPIVSTHGTEDNTVPYEEGTIQIFLIDVDEVDGSAAIHERVDILGIDNCFYTFEGAGHVPHQNFDTYYDTTRAVITGFNSRMVCPSYQQICGYYDVTNPPEIDEEEPADCPQDIVEDGIVDINDMLIFLANYGCIGECVGDFNETGNVSISDLLSILAVYGSYCE